MEKKNSIQGILFYLLVGIIAIFFTYLTLVSTLSTNPTQLEKLSEMVGISGSPEMLASFALIQPLISLIIFVSLDFSLRIKLVYNLLLFTLCLKKGNVYLLCSGKNYSRIRLINFALHYSKSHVAGNLPLLLFPLHLQGRFLETFFVPL